MRYWLFKSEPSTWSWQDQVAKGDAGEEWSGVKNYQARNFMRDMKAGDLGFFYHSQTDRKIVGVVEIVAEAHPDSTTDDERWECVDIKARDPLTRPVSLENIKSNPKLANMVLVRNSRLSVQPVTGSEWQEIMEMSRS